MGRKKSKFGQDLHPGWPHMDWQPGICTHAYQWQCYAYGNFMNYP